MTQKQFISVLIGVLLIGVLFVATSPSDRPATYNPDDRLFGKVAPAQVASLRIEKGDSVATMAANAEGWKLTSKSDYPADSGKVQSLLIKVFDIPTSQRVPANEESLNKLGVSDEQVKRGNVKITMSDKDGKALGILRIGMPRQGAVRSNLSPTQFAGTLGGNYVRRGDDPEVYLSNETLNFTASDSEWIDQNLLNVLGSTLRSVQVVSESNDQSSVEIDLKKKPGDTSSFPAFESTSAAPEGKQLQEATIGQLRSGLENVRIADVFKSSDPKVSTLAYDMVTTFTADNGLVYSVKTAKKDDKIYAKLSAAFSEAAANDVRAEDAAKAAVSPSPAPAASATPSVLPEEGEAKKGASPTPTATPARTISNSQEAAKLQSRFEPWVYQFDSYVGSKFRLTKDDLFKAPTPSDGATEGGIKGLPPELAGAVPPGAVMDPGEAAEAGPDDAPDEGAAGE